MPCFKRIINPFTGRLQYIGFQVQDEYRLTFPTRPFGVYRIVYGPDAKVRIDQTNRIMYMHEADLVATMDLKVIGTDPTFPNATIVEKGYSVSGLSMDWAVTSANHTFNKYENLKQNGIAINGDGSGADNGTNNPETYTAAITEAAHGTGISVTIRGGCTYDNTLKTIDLTGKILWRTRVFYGESLLTSLTEAQIKALRASTLAKTESAGDYDMNTTGYKYWAFPESFTQPIAFVDFYTRERVFMDPAGPYTVSVTNAHGYTENYKVYRSFNILNASMKVKII